MVAPGHYCRKMPAVSAKGEPLTDANGQPVWSILEGSDPNKDQSYFLCQLTQEQLAAAVFPIGDLPKPEVRRLAKEADLPSADKKDSQGICFVGKVDLPTFLQQQLKSVEGDVVEMLPAYYEKSELHAKQQELLARRNVATEANGTTKPVAVWSDAELALLAEPLSYADVVLEKEFYRSGKKHIKRERYRENGLWKHAGRHEGAQFFTQGQRKGLAIGGHKDPLFVVGTDVARNLVFVGEGESFPGLFRSCLRVLPEEIHWIRADKALRPGEEMRAALRIRYRQPLQAATLYMRADGLYIVFDEPQRSITPGQFAAWYVKVGDGGQEYEMLGSGVIER